MDHGEETRDVPVPITVLGEKLWEDELDGFEEFSESDDPVAKILDWSEGLGNFD